MHCRRRAHPRHKVVRGQRRWLALHRLPGRKGHRDVCWSQARGSTWDGEDWKGRRSRHTRRPSQWRTKSVSSPWWSRLQDKQGVAPAGQLSSCYWFFTKTIGVKYCSGKTYSKSFRILEFRAQGIKGPSDDFYFPHMSEYQVVFRRISLNITYLILEHLLLELSRTITYPSPNQWPTQPCPLGKTIEFYFIH